MPMVIDVLRYYAGLGQPRFTAKRVNTVETAFTYTCANRGVVGLIVPWNFPLLLASWKLGPAAGLWEHNCLEAREPDFTDCASASANSVEAGVPAGVLNIVTGRSEVGRSIVPPSRNRQNCLHRIDGRWQGNHAQRADSMKRLTLELGGQIS